MITDLCSPDDQAPMVALHRAISQGLPHRARKFLSQR